jgi:Ca2+-binding EF-hand superfamily protein
MASAAVVNVHEILTSDEIEDCHRAFRAFDTDHSGTIESWELKGILEALGQKPTDQEILHIIS